MTSYPALAPITLTASGLSVARGERLLVGSLDLRVVPGGVALVRGPNGAGKSSLLLVLAGILRPHSGSFSLGEADPAEFGRLVHYVGHQTGVKTRLTLAENLDFWGRMQGGGGLPVNQALERVGLGGRGELDAGYLSAGQTRRLALARLLVSRRPLWLLDEPTSALDADGHRLVEALLSEHAATGGSAVVATHDDLSLAPPVRAETLLLGAVA